MPSSIFLLSQPAIAIYVKASAASVAENLVLAPISRALSLRVSKSSPVTPLIAFTFDIAASKSMPTATEAVPIAAKGAVIFFVRLLPTLEILSPILVKVFPMSPIFFRAVFVLADSSANFFSSNSVFIISC